MSMMLPRTNRRRNLLSGVVVLWGVVWIALGVVTGLQIKELTEVSDSLVQSGQALETAGAALEVVGRLPLIGDASERFGSEVRRTAENVQAAGASSRETVRTVSMLLAAAVILIPIVPIIGLYVPLRISLARERRAVAKALDQIDRHPHLEEFLAHRAVQHLSYDALSRVSTDPWGDLERGSFRALANAELTSLGLAGRGRTRETTAGQ